MSQGSFPQFSVSAQNTDANVRLVISEVTRIFNFVKGKLALPIALMIVFALSRIPGMLPQNFSAAYALAFCAGVYFSGGMAWWLPLGALVITDIGLDLYYLAMGWNVFEL